MPLNGQGDDGDIGNDADDSEKLKHCCGRVAKLLDCVYHLLHGG